MLARAEIDRQSGQLTARQEERSNIVVERDAAQTAYNNSGSQGDLDILDAWNHALADVDVQIGLIQGQLASLTADLETSAGVSNATRISALTYAPAPTPSVPIERVRKEVASALKLTNAERDLALFNLTAPATGDAGAITNRAQLHQHFLKLPSQVKNDVATALKTGLTNDGGVTYISLLMGDRGFPQFIDDVFEAYGVLSDAAPNVTPSVEWSVQRRPHKALVGGFLMWRAWDLLNNPGVARADADRAVTPPLRAMTEAIHAGSSSWDALKSNPLFDQGRLGIAAIAFDELARLHLRGVSSLFSDTSPQPSGAPWAQKLRDLAVVSFPVGGFGGGAASQGGSNRERGQCSGE